MDSEAAAMQWFRVDKFCKELIKIRESLLEDSGKNKDVKENRLKFLKWLYRFDDETENQC